MRGHRGGNGPAWRIALLILRAAVAAAPLVAIGVLLAYRG